MPLYTPGTVTGRAVLNAPDATAARIAVGAGTIQQTGITLLGEYAHLAGHGTGTSTEESMQYREGQLGRTFAIHHTQFYDMHDTAWPGTLEQGAVAAGRRVVVSVRGYPPNEVNAGTHDAQITAAAVRCKAFGKPLLVRYAWEMNGNWFAWSPCYTGNGNDPAAFVRAWKHTVQLFRAAGVTNVQWAWVPNSNSSPGGSNGGADTTHWNNWRYYYPGDSWVDWVGMSAYNFGDNPLGGSHWVWMQTAAGTLLADYRAGFGGRTAAAKPFMFGEWGSHATPGGRGFWFSDAAGWIVASGIDAVLYFDTDDAGATYGYSDAQSLAAMKEIALAPAFGGTGETGSGYPAAVLTDTPVNYWRFNDPAGDFVDSGSARIAATPVSTPQRRVPAYKPGLGSPAVAFKGNPSSAAGIISGYLSVTSATLGTSVGSQTWEFLFKAESTLTGGTYLLGEANTVDSQWFGIGLNRGAGFAATAGSTLFYWRDSLANTDHRAIITTNLYDGLWHHVVWVQNRTTPDVVYIDGAAVTTATTGSYGAGTGMTATNWQWPIYVGGRNFQNSYDGASTCAIDELAVYTSALSAGRVAAHYAALTA